MSKLGLILAITCASFSTAAASEVCPSRDELKLWADKTQKMIDAAKARDAAQFSEVVSAEAKLERVSIGQQGLERDISPLTIDYLNGVASIGRPTIRIREEGPSSRFCGGISVHWFKNGEDRRYLLMFPKFEAGKIFNVIEEDGERRMPPPIITPVSR